MALDWKPVSALVFGVAGNWWFGQCLAMTIRLEICDTAATLLIDRADRRNAITMEMWLAIPRLLDQAAGIGGLRVLTVRGVDGAPFSAGADIHEMIANKDDADWIAANHAAISQAQHRLERFDLPTIAFVDGDCIGGGCAVALACDIRVATQRARFGITPAKLGLAYPFHDIKLLVDLVGPGQAKRLLYTGDLIDASEAHNIGLVEIVAGSSEVLEQSIAATSGNSHKAMKRMVRHLLDGQADESGDTRAIFAAAFEGDDFREGTMAFAEKRLPQFKS